MNTENYDALKKIIKIYLPEDVSVDDITPNSHLINELNINSANLVDVVLDIEDKYDIEIDNESMDKMLNVRASLEVIQAKVASK